MKNKVVLIMIAILYVVASVWLTNYAIKSIRNKYSPEKGLISFYEDDVINLIYEDQLDNSYGSPIIEGNEILLPFHFVKEYIDDTISFDEGRAKITITSKDQVIRISNDTLQAYLNMEPYTLDASSRYINEILYLPVRAFSEVFAIDITYDEKNNVVIIDDQKNYVIKGYLTNEQAYIRSEMSIYKPIYKVYHPEDIEVIVYETMGDWSKVRSSDGIIGYVENKYLKSEIIYSQVELDIRKDVKGELDTIIFAWEAFYSATKGDAVITDNEVLNVISPTWFKVVDQIGNINSFADISYVEKSDALGYQVWPLFSNTFNDVEMTSKVLNNSDTRDHMIKQMIAYAALYNFDGISLDFENIYLSDKDAYTQLIRELVPMAHLANLKVSVAVGVPYGSERYSLCYDHEAIGNIADYVMVMTYDQYYAGSKVAGSQAQISWMENMINNTLDFVDKEKLVMGIPLYTRLWEVNEEGAKNVNTYSIDRVKALIEEKNATVLWDEDSGQYVASYTEDGKNYQLWIEDENSLKEKVALAFKKQLKGICMWELNWGNETMWTVIEEEMSREDE